MVRRPSGCLGNHAPRSPTQGGRVLRRRPRSHEPGCPRSPSHRGIQAGALSGNGPLLPRNAPSDPPRTTKEIVADSRVFTQPGSQPVPRELNGNVRFSNESGHRGRTARFVQRPQVRQEERPHWERSSRCRPVGAEEADAQSYAPTAPRVQCGEFSRRSTRQR